MNLGNQSFITFNRDAIISTKPPSLSRPRAFRTSWFRWRRFVRRWMSLSLYLCLCRRGTSSLIFTSIPQSTTLWAFCSNWTRIWSTLCRKHQSAGKSNPCVFRRTLNIAKTPWKCCHTLFKLNPIGPFWELSNEILWIIVVQGASKLRVWKKLP